MNFYLLSFNNYYNRQVKKFDTFAEYQPYILYVVENTNFVPGDGVNTQKLVNYDGETQPDYALVTDEFNEIKSRWFVIDSDWNRQGQYNVTLHRDMVADSYDDVISAPCYIEKAIVDNNDPAIYNLENMGFNQIKTSETPLKDETGTPWIVGYIPSDSFTNDTNVNSTFVNAGNPDIKVDSISNWPYYKYTQLITSGTREKPIVASNIEYNCKFNFVLKKHGDYGDEIMNPMAVQAAFDGNGNNIPGPAYGDTTIGSGGYILKGFNFKQLAGYLSVSSFDAKNLADRNPRANLYLQKVVENLKPKMTTINNNIYTQAKQRHNYVINNGVVNELRALDGKKIYDNTNKTLYRISVKEYLMDKNETYTPTTFAAQYPKNLSFKSGLYEFNSNGAELFETTAILNGSYLELNLTQEDINIKTTVLGIKNRTHLIDAPYDMFCMPYNNDFEITDNGKVYKNSQFAALNMAIGVAAGTGSGNVYDVQLLPYCPVRNAIIDGKFDITGIPHNAITSADGTTTYSYMIWCDKSDFTFDIPYSIAVDDYKVSNECDMYRLCSPNYSSAFEFSAAQNKGVTLFNVDCTYKPFNPYVHINPDFKGLFGSDFNDARGLILGGDYSITQLSSAWANYELTNKNFQASFDRNIENMKTNQKYQRASEITNAITGAVQGGVSGGIIGSLGGPIGMGIGAAVGAGLSAGAGAADVIINDKLRAEALDYAQDQFNFQVGNIQAIPYTLTKTTALTANNKLFPIIEYYTCTPEEKQALRNKIKYNGMTINRIGTIADFIMADETFIKGKLIRINIPEDYHYVNALSGEINKGLFIKGGNQ